MDKALCIHQCYAADLTILATVLLGHNGDEICLQQQLNCEFDSGITCRESQAMSATEWASKDQANTQVAGKIMVAKLKSNNEPQQVSWSLSLWAAR